MKHIKLFLLCFASILVITSCRSWSIQKEYILDKYSVKVKYRTNPGYLVNERQYYPKIGYVFLIADLNITHREKVKTEILYKNILLVIETTEGEQLELSPVIVDCGYLCLYSIEDFGNTLGSNPRNEIRNAGNIPGSINLGEDINSVTPELVYIIFPLDKYVGIKISNVLLKEKDGKVIE